jgi:hypothetical protein
VIQGLVGAVKVALALAVAMLPRRYWASFEPALPVSNAVPGAALITLLAGPAIGIPGFFAHLQEIASQNNAAYLEAAARVEGETMPMSSTLSGLAIFTFVLLTPSGWISSYLTVSGLVRVIGSHVDDPHGDLLLTTIDAGVRKVRRATAQRAEIDNRHLLEGPRVQDRIAHGAEFDLPQADVVIVSSRLKDGWDPGAVVLSDRGAFRIVDARDHTIAGRLRRLYALARHEDLEVFRRTVSYEFPPSKRSAPAATGIDEPTENSASD